MATASSSAVVSNPVEVVGGGQNAKYIRECKELYLGNKGIQKLRGFEPFVNLESLWLNSNKLKKLNNLDSNFRIRTLYAQDNQICTLKGSLLNFRFLETLDLSNNQLRDLEKQLQVLEKFHFLTHLNLTGNPVCEEPDYRLLVIHRIPSLKVLDQHVITQGERNKAKGMIGGDVATLTVAFGKRVPAYDPAWDEKVPERSALEQDLAKEATCARDTMRHEAYMRERSMLMTDPYPESARGRSLPPNAGTVRAMQVWQHQHQQQAGTNSGGSGGPASTSGLQDLGGSMSPAARAGRLSGRQGSGHASPDSSGLSDSYRPRDKLVLYTLRPSPTELQASGTALTQPPPGPIQFEQDKYEEFVRGKAMGSQGNWQLGKAALKL